MSANTDRPPYQQRRQKLVDRLDGASMLVSNLVNVRYLTGFTGSNAFFLVNDSASLLLTDGRYVEQVASECPDLEARIRPIESSMLDLAVETLGDCNVTDCFIEADSMTRAMWRDLVEAGKENVAFQDSSGIVEALRAIKGESELALIRQSVSINEAALLATLSSFSESWTEQEFGWHLEREIRQRGGSGFSFDPIVAGGPSSALPHYHGTSVGVSNFGFLLVDWGTSFGGYASDLTRMVDIGNVPEKIREVHQIVSDAKQAAADAVCDGVELRDVDQAARKHIADSGYGDLFNHGLGHGFGLEIHETPFMSPAFDGQLRSGMVITIEPGIYLPEIGGVRLEDDFLVTADGCEKLNGLPDDFLTL